METVGGSNEDDLTIKLGDIVLINDLIRKSMEHGNPITQLADKWEFLQQSVALYINSEYPGIPASLAAKKAIRGLAQRLKGKQGRFRGNLSGKRVDFSSRTVISPDPNIRVDEVGLPLYICKILTYPERVTKYNIDELRKLILNGNDEYPGARFVEYPNGDKKFLKYARRDQIASSLKIGDIVERHLRNGDIVLFNRQPSLHRNSIMAHRVRVLPDRTFRLNECVCTPYNADFDGDEMNIHVPQTEEARAEAAVLLSVPNNLCVPKSGELIIAAIQDFLTASYLITKKDTFYDRAVFVQIVSYFTDGLLDVELPQPAILKPMELFTGKQIFSVLINPNPSKCPVNVSFEQKNRNYNAAKDYGPMDPTDCYIIVQNGELLTGQLDKAALGGGRGNLFHVLSKDFDPNIAVDRMSRLARLCSRWITNHGFSMGISDVQPSQDLVNKKIKLVNQGYAKCEEYIQQAKEGKLKPQPGLTLEQTLEGLITSELSSLRDQAGKLCMDELQTWNPPLIMTLCGSKGSKINISQMIAAVGQQTVGGSRIPNGFVNRTLPHFDVNAKDPAAKGFVSNSFYSGLTPTEFFFHTMAGREGLVDTAVKTAETGYMQRRLMKALEDLAVQYDGTVRQSSGGVVQFTYGDDSFDPAQIEHEENPCDYQRILLNCFCFSRHGMYLEPQEIVDFVDTKLASEKFSYLSDHHKQNLRLVWRNDTKAKNSKDQLIVGLVDKIVELRKSLSLPSGLKENEDTKAETAKKTDDLSPITTGLNIHDQSANSLKELYEEKINFVRRIYPVTDVMLDNFFERVNKKLRKIQMHAGEAVGAVAAQSIGEPCTQMTLKTFHFAGVASMNITLGVPRIQEIINATKTISTPIITGKLVGPESPVFQRIMSHVSKNRQIVGNERELFARIIKGEAEWP
jgi:DNA-directed RNA polymerase III subunit RPC1